jgi:hypothetical protein
MRPDPFHQPGCARCRTSAPPRPPHPQCAPPQPPPPPLAHPPPAPPQPCPTAHCIAHVRAWQCARTAAEPCRVYREPPGPTRRTCPAAGLAPLANQRSLRIEPGASMRARPNPHTCPPPGRSAPLLRPALRPPPPRPRAVPSPLVTAARPARPAPTPPSSPPPAKNRASNRPAYVGSCNLREGWSPAGRPELLAKVLMVWHAGGRCGRLAGASCGPRRPEEARGDQRRPSPPAV